MIRTKSFSPPKRKNRRRSNSGGFSSSNKNNVIVYDDAVWVSGDAVMPMKRVREIGRGAFGLALLVKREGEEALKVLKRVIVENKSTKEHLQAQREGKIMKRLVHRNVVKVVSTFSTLSHSNGYALRSVDSETKSITLNKHTQRTSIQYFTRVLRRRRSIE